MESPPAPLASSSFGGRRAMRPTSTLLRSRSSRFVFAGRPRRTQHGRWEPVGSNLFARRKRPKFGSERAASKEPSVEDAGSRHPNLNPNRIARSPKPNRRRHRKAERPSDDFGVHTLASLSNDAVRALPESIEAVSSTSCSNERRPRSDHHHSGAADRRKGAASSASPRGADWARKLSEATSGAEASNFCRWRRGKRIEARCAAVWLPSSYVRWPAVVGGFGGSCCD